jgi:hypothetical protein
MFEVRVLVILATSWTLALVNCLVSHDGLLVHSPRTRLMIEKTWTLFLDGSYVGSFCIGFNSVSGVPNPPYLFSLLDQIAEDVDTKIPKPAPRST